MIVCVTTRIQQLKRTKFERDLLKLLRESGISRSKVEEIPEEFGRKPSKGQTYYYYTGPLDDKTRPFCAQILKMDKVFSEKEINKISKLLGYDVLEDKGAYNCRHNWVKFRGKEISGTKPTVKEMNDLIRKGISVK